MAAVHKHDKMNTPISGKDNNKLKLHSWAENWNLQQHFWENLKSHKLRQI